jgi:hypothetical protein
MVGSRLPPIRCHVPPVNLSNPFAGNVDSAWPAMAITICCIAQHDARPGKPAGIKSAAEAADQACNGAVEKTRTSTGCPTATSTLRVYQFRHDRLESGLM